MDFDPQGLCHHRCHGCFGIPGAEDVPHVCITPLLGLIPSSKPAVFLAATGQGSHGKQLTWPERG